MGSKLRPYAIAIGSTFGLVGFFVIVVLVMSLLAGAFDTRTKRAVGKGEAQSLCSDYLRKLCETPDMQFIKGDYEEGWLVGGTANVVFELDESKQDDVFQAFQELPNFDSETEAVKQDGMFVFLTRIGKNRLQLVFTNS